MRKCVDFYELMVYTDVKGSEMVVKWSKME